MARFVWDDDLEAWVSRANYFRPSSVAIIRDDLPGGINGMLSHADGRRYTSKSAYGKGVRRAGCEIVGNDSMSSVKRPDPHADRREVGNDIKRAMEQLGSR